MSTRRRLALIDADVVVYRVGYAGQDSKHSVIDLAGDVLGTFDSKKEANDYSELMALSGTLDPYIETEILPKGHDEIEMMTEIMIKNIVSGSRSTEYHMYLSGPTNFRKELATLEEYKGARKGNVKPIHYSYIREYIEENHPTFMSDNCEADDLLAIRQYPDFLKAKESKRKRDCETVICTIDKDLRTVPGHHYNFVKQILDWVTPTAANRFFATQMLTGDNADSIPGLSRLSEGAVKIGPKRAADIIVGCSSIKNLDRAVRGAYAEHVPGDWQSKLQEVGSLLWMQRKPNQEFHYEDWSKGRYE